MTAPPAQDVEREPAGPPAPRKSSAARLSRRRGLWIAATVWLMLGWYVVPTDQQAVETIFGAVSDARVGPGAHYNAPWPIGRVHRLRVRLVRRVFVGGEIADQALGRLDPISAEFLTGDHNVIHVRAVAQYSIVEPREFLFNAARPEAILRGAVESELGREISARTVDEALTTEKVAIQQAVRGRAQTLIDAYGLGVVVSEISIETAAAPPEAADAFRDVASARADAARLVSEARGYADDILPRARGEARGLIERAKSYRVGETRRAEGDAARFGALTEEYAKNPETTRRRLYLETMEEVLPRLKKTVVDDAGNLDLNFVRRAGPQGADRGGGGWP